MEAKRKRKPEWLRIDLRNLDKDVERVNSLVKQKHLHTVCDEAQCPNRLECYKSGTATFMILGNKCTRNCRFCDVGHDNPNGVVDALEPKNVAEAAKTLNLKHVVITSVTRDDLKDGGAKQFSDCVFEIRNLNKGMTVELLIPDLKGKWIDLETIVKSKPEVLNHNIETVPKLYTKVRPGALYNRSLELLKMVKSIDNTVFTKSGIMVGLGESKEEVKQTLKDLREVDCDFLTIGQYLQPSREHLEVDEYIHPDIFKEYEEYAYEIGFKFVASGPFVRSSYKANVPL